MRRERRGPTPGRALRRRVAPPLSQLFPLSFSMPSATSDSRRPTPAASRQTAWRPAVRSLLAASVVASLAACASAPPGHSPAAAAAPSAAPAFPRLQCDFATWAPSWQAVTAGLGRQAVRLRADGLSAAPDIMARVLDLGQVQVRSAKPTAAISRVGIPNKLPARWTRPTGDADKDRQQAERHRANGNGYFEGPVDLRFRFPAWAHAFAWTATTEAGCPQRSLVFFNAQGQLVHSVTLANSSHAAAFDRLVRDFRHAEQRAPALAAAPAAATARTPDASVDLAAYHQAWRQITDVHQFNRVMRDFGLGREQALRLAPEGKVRRLQPAAPQALLERAAASGLPVMVFVSNGAVTQIHADPVHHVRREGDWLVVDDPTSHIALNAAKVASAWQIERGGIYSVDAYEADGTLIASFFGVRTRENPEPKAWIELVKGLP